MTRPRIRSLKPELFQHHVVGPLSHRAFRLWIGGISHADDAGRLVAAAPKLRALIFGYHPRVRAADVNTDLQTLARLGLVRLYVVKGVRYMDYPNWTRHQKINRSSGSNLPSYEDSLKRQGVLTEDSPPDRIRSGSGSDQESPPLTPPSALEQFVAKFALLEAYQTLDVRTTTLACEAWCKANGKAFSERRVCNWLNTELRLVAAGRARNGPLARGRRMNENTAAVARRFAARQDPDERP
jgi:hypothetical protein